LSALLNGLINAIHLKHKKHLIIPTLMLNMLSKQNFIHGGGFKHGETACHISRGRPSSQNSARGKRNQICGSLESEKFNVNSASASKGTNHFDV
jgi:hypothetical protein